MTTFKPDVLGLRYIKQWQRKKSENSVRYGTMDESLQTSGITEAKKRKNFQKTHKKYVGEATPKRLLEPPNPSLRQRKNLHKQCVW